MCTGRCQFRKPGAVERNQRAENIGAPCPVIFRTSVSPYAQQRPTWHHGHQTAEMEGGFCFESTPPAEPMFDVYQEAHSGALHRTYRRRTRVHVPPMKQAASNELTAGQLATAVAAGSPQAPQPAPSRRPDLCRGLAHQQQHPAHPTAGRPPGRIEAGYNTNPSPQGAGTSPLLPMEPSGSLWWRCWV